MRDQTKESVLLRKKKLEVHFGILTEEEAREMLEAIEESRKLTNERVWCISKLFDNTSS